MGRTQSHLQVGIAQCTCIGGSLTNTSIVLVFLPLLPLRNQPLLLERPFRGHLLRSLPPRRRSSLLKPEPLGRTSVRAKRTMCRSVPSANAVNRMRHRRVTHPDFLTGSPRPSRTSSVDSARACLADLGGVHSSRNGVNVPLVYNDHWFRRYVLSTLRRDTCTPRSLFHLTICMNLRSFFSLYLSDAQVAMRLFTRCCVRCRRCYSSLCTLPSCPKSQFDSDTHVCNCELSYASATIEVARSCRTQSWPVQPMYIVQRVLGAPATRPERHLPASYIPALPWATPLSRDHHSVPSSVTFKTSSRRVSSYILNATRLRIALEAAVVPRSTPETIPHFPRQKEWLLRCQ